MTQLEIIDEENQKKSTMVDWQRIDKMYSRLCCCFSYPNALVMSATTGSFLYGWNTACLNTAISQIASDFEWCGIQGYTGCQRATTYQSLCSTGVYLGAAFGALGAGYVLSYGPRKVLMASFAIAGIGILASVASNGFSSLLWSRIVLGLGVGLSSVATPNFIGEIAPPGKRGMYGTLHQFVLVTAQLLAVTLGLAFTIVPDEGKGNELTAEQLAFKLPAFDRVWWRVLMGLGLLPVIAAAVFLVPVFRCETPHYYVRQNNLKDAAEALRRIYRKDDVSEELASIVENSKVEMKTAKMPLKDTLKQPGYSLALWVGLGISVFQQLTGVNAFVTSSNRLFSDAGLSKNKVTYASMGLVGVMVSCTIFPLILMDRIGRRSIMLIGSVGMALSTLPATIMYFTEWNAETNSTALTVLAIVGACLFILFFALSAGPVTWVYIFEIFPLEMKAQGSAMCVAVNWLGSILMVFGGGFLPAKVIYVIFTVMSILNLIFVYLFMKETQGRDLGDSPFTHRTDISIAGAEQVVN